MTDAFTEALAGQFDILAWADEVERKLPLQTDAALLRADWNAGKHRLYAADRQRFHDLNFKLAQRAKELDGGAP